MKRQKTIKQAPDGTLYTDESDIQQAFVFWFSVAYKEHFDNLVSIPNGAHMAGAKVIKGKRVNVQAARMKREGMKAGAADLALFLMRGGYGALFIEMKTPTGRASEEQIQFGRTMIKSGYAYVICKGRNEAEKAVNDYVNEKYEQKEI